MSLSVCPAATIAAPVERVWALLANPAGFGAWVDGTVESIDPPGPARPGQIVALSSAALGRRWHIGITIDRVDCAQHRIGFRVRLPFGVVEHSELTCLLLDEDSCLVRFG